MNVWPIFGLKKGLAKTATCTTNSNMVFCPKGTVANGMEALCIMLRRQAFPCRLVDIIPLFGRSAPELSLICSETVDHIHNTFGGVMS